MPEATIIESPELGDATAAMAECVELADERDVQVDTTATVERTEGANDEEKMVRNAPSG